MRKIEDGLGLSEFAGHSPTNQHRHALPTGLSADQQRGLEAAHIDRDEVRVAGVHGSP